MFSGLLDEAASLLVQGIPAGSSTASRAIGYRQAMQLLQSKAGAAMHAEAEAARTVGTAADARKSGEALAAIGPDGSSAADGGKEATTAGAPSTAASIANASPLPAEACATAAVVTAQDLDQLVREIITATHKLVRSQMTWFRWGQPGGGVMGRDLGRDGNKAGHLDRPGIRLLAMNVLPWLRCDRDDGVYRWMDMSGGSTASVADAIVAEAGGDVHLGERKEGIEEGGVHS